MSELDILTAPATVAAIQAHAKDCFPREACGIITRGGFVPLANRSPNPERFFDCADEAAAYQIRGTLLAVVHSHCAMPGEGLKAAFPSRADMEQQLAMEVPWGICAVSAVGVREPWWWGPGIPIPDLIGRSFRHGPCGSDGRGDCYALIKDYYEITHGITIADVPRDWEWWMDGTSDLYLDNFERVGYRRIHKTDVQIGDVGFATTPVVARDGKALPPRALHGVIYVGDGQVLHHKPGHLSVIEPLGAFNKTVNTWVRHVSKL